MLSLFTQIVTFHLEASYTNMATKTTKPKTFKAAYEELEKIAEQFESEELDLEKGLKDFERGLELAKICKDRLGELEIRVKEIQAKFDV